MFRRYFTKSPDPDTSCEITTIDVRRAILSHSACVPARGMIRRLPRPLVLPQGTSKDQALDAFDKNQVRRSRDGDE